MVAEATEGRVWGWRVQKEGRWSFRAMPLMELFSFELSKMDYLLKINLKNVILSQLSSRERAPRPWAPTDMHLGLCLRRALFHSREAAPGL